MHLKELSAFLDGFAVSTDGEFEQMGLLATQNGKGMLSFIENEKYLNDLYGNKSVSCIIAKKEFADRAGGDGRAVIVSESPRLTFFAIHHALLAHTDFYGAKKANEIAASAKIHPSAHIAANNVRIGERVEIGPNVVVGEKVEIGDDARIGANAVLGGDGFECFRAGDAIINVRHAGSVLIGRAVSMHSNVCVDRGLFGNATIIEENCSLDNFVHISHNVHIGRRTRIAAMAMIAGRTVIGEDGWIGPNVLVSNGLTIGNRCNLVMGSIVTKSTGDGKTVMWRIAY